MAKRSRSTSRPGKGSGDAAGAGKAGAPAVGGPNGRSSRKGTTADYRHAHEKRANIPPAKIAAEGQVPAIPKARYSYSPHRPPVLRFDPAGEADRLAELAAKVEAGEALTDDERAELAAALRAGPAHEPWLEWAAKREEHQRGHFDVDPVALHMHERVSAQAILKVAARQDVDRGLFGDPEQEYHEAVQFYRHEIDWTNRLILGDSLQVMSSLARRENLAGKVQMIYIDPPYGIKFASNFQPEVGTRDVKDNDSGLTREAEMVRAYRDAWHLGVHSYMSYLRDRLIVARELLAETGSVFVQIGDENLHRMRCVLDELYGPLNFIGLLTIRKTTGSTADFIPGSCDYLLWYARNRQQALFRPIYTRKRPGEEGATGYKFAELPSGERISSESHLPDNAFVFAGDNITSQSMGRDKGEGAASWFKVFVDGQDFTPGPKARWKTNEDGMRRLLRAERLVGGNRTTMSYKRRLDDFPVTPLANIWLDTVGQNQLGGDKTYVVQTALKIVERCMLMTTDPGDLVLDPTCGSGTTAFVAEQWGRRWITIDTSRVAVAIARQRLLTAKFDHYRIKDSTNGTSGGVDPHPGFVYKPVSHITLKSIAQNTNLDPIFTKHEPILNDALAACNKALAPVTDAQREALALKLARKVATDGWRAPTDADYRRWLLPGTTRAMIEKALAAAFAGTKKKVTAKQIAGLVERIPTHAEVGPSSVSKSGLGWEHWQIPFDTDTDWPKPLVEIVSAYRKAWRAKMDEVNQCIADNAEQEELVDQPEKIPGVVRVSGPFSVEAVQPPEMSLGDVVDAGEPSDFDSFAGAPEELESFDPGDLPRQIHLLDTRGEVEARNAAAYLRKMYELLRDDGVTFPSNKHMVWATEEQGQPLTPLFDDGRADMIHAEGQWTEQAAGEAGGALDDRVAVAFGPQYGPVTAKMVEELIRSANRAGYDALVIAAFSFDGPAQQVIDEAQHPKLKIHMAHIRPDVNPGMDGLLKDPSRQKSAGGNGKKASSAGSQQLFTVFGQPRLSLAGPDAAGEYVVTMEGVDIYDPVENAIRPTKADKVAAWFLDTDYDGRTFCITQAFFPDRSAWEKLSKALKGVIDEDRFAALAGTDSLPFPKGKHGRAAVKVIDPRGNEVMKVVTL